MKSVIIRNMNLGRGVPKICVPLVNTDREGLLRDAASLQRLNADMAEWRADWYGGILEPGSLASLLSPLRRALGEIPLLFTFRTFREGGNLEASPSSYLSLLREAICSGYTDAVDVELFSGKDTVKELVSLAHERQVKVILSNHDFDSTPCREELVKRLRSMEEMGADIAKIAVMPGNAEDVLTLLSATVEADKLLSCPVVTMSMRGMGLISRLSGEIFGSCLTFGSAGKASAPGQICAGELREILEIIHRNQPLS
ncbi:MAG: type I 3-dehydroquinate dehydratase [Clostridium sp.]|nr:type I 3-dehydroquinate dehydratase [Clostridium sp.]